MKILRKMLSVVLSSVVVLSCGSVLHADTGIEIDKSNFPDRHFRNFLQIMYDCNMDWCLDSNEIAKITSIGSEKRDYQIDDLYDVTSFQGIEYLTNLETFHLAGIDVESLDLSKNTKLKDIELSSCTSLEHLKVGSGVTHLYLAGCVNLFDMDLSQAYNLESMTLTPFGMVPKILTNKTLDLSACSKLSYLYVAWIPLTNIKFSSNITKLEVDVDCGTRIKYLDFSTCKSLTYLKIHGEDVTSIDLPTQLFTIYSSKYRVSGDSSYGTYKGNGCTLIF